MASTVIKKALLRIIKLKQEHETKRIRRITNKKNRTSHVIEKKSGNDGKTSSPTHMPPILGRTCISGKRMFRNLML